MAFASMNQPYSPVYLALVTILALAAVPGGARAQDHSVTVTVLSGTNAIPGAQVSAATTGAGTSPTISATDVRGNTTLVLKSGTWLVTASKRGLRTDSTSIQVNSDTSFTLNLIPSQAATLAPVIVGTSRVNRRIEDEPERVETLAGEDVDEKSIMRPADPTRLLAEMPGVRVQPVGASLGGAGIRLRGMRGHYTLALADGLPLYGQVQGISFLDIPPLDIRQAEIIKGAATALYGPSALAGVLNIISRKPPRAGTSSDALINVSSQGGQDLVAWHGRALQKGAGITVLGGAHHQSRRDINSDRWADIPDFTRGEMRVRGFQTRENGSNTMWTAGASRVNRNGGSVGALSDGRSFPLGAETTHADLGTVVHSVRSGSSMLSMRGSLAAQHQRRQFGDSVELDTRTTGLVEAVLAHNSESGTTLFGASGNLDRLESAKLANARYSFTSAAAFAQITRTIGRRFAVSGTARLDEHQRYGLSLSPRLSALAHLIPGWTLRTAGGMSTSAPTPLVEDAEATGLSRVRGLSSLGAETFRDASADINGHVGAIEINAGVFASRLNNAVVVREGGSDPRVITLLNAPSPTRIHGLEVFALYGVEPISLTALYSLTSATEWSADKRASITAPLIPRQAGGIDLAFAEDESGTRVGLEVFYTGRQSLEDNPYRKTSKAYMTVGILAEQRIGKATLYINADNLGDVRQTRFEPFLRPRQSATGRWTTDQWAPLEGRTINAGARVRF